MSESLNEPLWYINKMINQLDDVASGYEAVWGVGKLESLVPPDLARKWDAQKLKLDEAIQAGDENRVRLLVDGCIRGYGALNDAALSAGYKPITPDFWEYKHPSGQIYRVCKNNFDSQSLHKTVDKGVIIMSLGEIINLYHAQQNRIYASLDEKAIPERKKDAFDFTVGDQIPSEF
jgi:hypothetical protein